MTQHTSGRTVFPAVLMIVFVLLLGHATTSLARGGGDDRRQAKVRNCANGIRARHGLHKLHNSKPLNQAASLHAHDMARQGFFGHIDPKGRGPLQRVRKFPGGGVFGSVGENIAFGYREPKAACKAWRKSPDHRANILNPKFSFIGGGFARNRSGTTYYVQVFARR